MSKTVMLEYSDPLIARDNGDRWRLSRPPAGYRFASSGVEVPRGRVPGSAPLPDKGERISDGRRLANQGPQSRRDAP